MTNDVQPIVSARGVTKHFGGITALAGVGLTVLAGEVHALVGENGAGKSTLMNILAGVLPPDEGELIIAGERLTDLDPIRAHEHGIGFVRQDPTVLPDLTVRENVTLGVERRRFGWFESSVGERDVRACLARVQLDHLIDVPVERLSIAQRHLLDVAKVLFTRPKVLIMDEPTAALTPSEAELLFAIIREQAAEGGSVIYISHRFDEIFALADRATVLRDGCVVGVVNLTEVDQDQLITMMVGRELGAAFPHRSAERPAGTDDTVRITLPGLLREVRPADPDLTVRGGEILAIAGLVGSGRTELVEGIFGAGEQRNISVELSGTALRHRTPARTAQRGLALVPEDRRRQGLIGMMSIADNITLGIPRRISIGGLVRPRAEQQIAAGAIQSLAIKAEDPSRDVSTLSGGNQQKVVIAKWVVRDSRVFLFDEPTKGVDVGARVSIYNQIYDLAAQGCAVIVVSSEMSEVLGLSDSILVMREGRPSSYMLTSEASAEDVLRAALGRSATP